jgi:FdhD protein
LATLDYKGYRLTADRSDSVRDPLIVETALSILINSEAFSVTMHTPGKEKELVLGLLNSEGILPRDSDFDFQVLESDDAGHLSKVNITLPEMDTAEIISKRTLLTSASCGICGNRELEIPKGKSIESSFTFESPALTKMYEVMHTQQNAFIKTGGSHAAAIFGQDQELLAISEDVGRHNAVDKSVGTLIEKGDLQKGKFLLVSGRISYEIVIKCFKARIPILAAVSAPSSLAVDFAKEFGITLLGFCREDRCTVFSHPNRIKNVHSKA